MFSFYLYLNTLIGLKLLFIFNVWNSWHVGTRLKCFLNCTVGEMLKRKVKFFFPVLFQTKKKKKKNLPAMQETPLGSWVRKSPWRRNSLPIPVSLDFPGGSDDKASACTVGDLGSIPGLGRSPGGGHGNRLQYSCLENPHGQRSLVGCSPWGCKESDMTEQLSTATMLLHSHNYFWITSYCSIKLMYHHLSNYLPIAGCIGHTHICVCVFTLSPFLNHVLLCGCSGSLLLSSGFL